MSVLTDMDQEVSRRAALRHGEIIGSTFRAVKKDHIAHAHRQCDCPFCSHLREYIGCKLRLHRLNKMERDDPSLDRPWLRVHLMQKLREARRAKNKLKNPII